MKEHKNIKVGFCVAYDWLHLKQSIPRVYQYVDTICLSLDAKRISWSGKPFDFDESSFFSWVREVDIDNKIRIYEDDFYVQHQTPLQNDSRQRLMMAKVMGEGGWHIQIDADEYIFDFKSFRDYLIKLIPAPSGKEKPLNVCVNSISLIKKVQNGYLFVNNETNSYEEFPIATNVPEYLAARCNSHFNHLSPFFILHETWARGEQELLRKINSWGHDNDFLSKDSYFNLWKALDEYNYQYIRNFHPLNPETWQKLGYVPELDIDKAIEWIAANCNLSFDNRYLLMRNSRAVQGIKQRLSKA